MTETKQKIKNVLNALPDKPGVYKMLDDEGRVIYVGKAKNLKKRVKSYFQKTNSISPRTQKLVENAADVSYTVVNSELEALILELNLIKELHPKYNILLKDDKNFVYVKITNEDFPRVQIVRKIDDKKATYFGPKTSKGKVEKTFQMLKKVFRFRHCNLDLAEKQDKTVEVTHQTIKYPCLDHYIHRCSAPCISNVTKEEYNKSIENIKRFFEGHHDEILRDIKKQMMELAANKQFEKAARLRDTLKTIESILERQSISDPNQEDKDIFNYTIESGKAFFNLFQVREGKLINQENFILQAAQVNDEDEEAKAELLNAFLEQYYEKTTNIPKEILIPHEFPDQDNFEEFLSEEKGRKVKILIPQKGQKNRLLELSHKNAKVFAERNRASWKSEGDDKKEILQNLKDLLNLQTIPKRIECYDISHLSGTDTVGSMVVFENGAPKNADYRRFKIRTLEKGDIDDFKSIAEVLSRRLTYIGEFKDDYVIEKAKKEDQKIIDEMAAGNFYDHHNLDYKKFFVAKKGKKVCGFVREKKIKESSKVSSLWVDEEARGSKLGHRLIKHLIKHSKAKRLYINCRPELASYYEQVGFTQINKAPQDLADDLKHIAKNSGEKNFPESVWYAYDRSRLRDKSFESKPDLIIIDGGKGQLSAAVEIMKKFNLKTPIISIAKQEEELFVPNSKTSIKLEKTDNIIKLIQRLRDEAHRFAISFNRELRAKKFK